YLLSQLRNQAQEVFACLFLNNKNRILHFSKLFHGTINSASVHPREVVKQCLYYHASAVIFAHNHPSGDPTPSQADIDITRLLKQALELVEVRVLDHVIIGDNQMISMAQHGLI